MLITQVIKALMVLTSSNILLSRGLSLSDRLLFVFHEEASASALVFSCVNNQYLAHIVYNMEHLWLTILSWMWFFV